jgi:hypothetical protein
MGARKVKKGIRERNGGRKKKRWIKEEKEEKRVRDRDV